MQEPREETFDSVFSAANAELNAIGMRCPEPVMMVRLQIRKMAEGERLAVVADDPSTTRDIPSFCRFMHHTLVGSDAHEAPFRYVIQKGL
ncbi:sulfurtransferase TusA [Alteromonas oceanisediminis]|uniref:sulfurtransferase TusA n=1 Tax=Alteromonas oceanisediminis TaxID=2836180 RepID=UPI001BD9CA32|nr:sulfurtransferase TusA [Alteromonas oceanisediminis]MBT0587912.1 sulfurtransferase TusA [Alteromonas oceanisediminis]